MKKRLSAFTLILLTRMVFSISTYAQVPYLQWQKTYGGSTADVVSTGQRKIQTSDHGFIILGSSRSNDGNVTGNHGEVDYWIVKTDSIGNIVWEESLGGSDNEMANSIQQTADGGYIVAGESESNDGNVTGNHGGYDYWVIKLSSSGNITWQKSLGGINDDKANFIQQTSDGGYIVAGSTWSSNSGDVGNSNGGADYWIVKLNSNGVISWQKSLGGGNADYAWSIQQTTNGGYIVAGYSYSNDGNVSGHHGALTVSDMWVVKINSAGIINWQKSLGGTGDEVAYSVQQTADSGYIACGYSYSNDGNVTGNHGGSDYWVVKLGSNGSILWQKSLGGIGEDHGNSAVQTSDGGYIVTGYSTSDDGDVTGHHGTTLGYDAWTVKLDSIGAISWQNSLGGTLSDYGSSIVQTIDGGYILSGWTDSDDGDVSGNHGIDDCWLVKLSYCTGSPIATITNYGNTTFCAGSDVLLAGAFNYSAYQWQKNGINISGATNKIYVANTTGNYSCNLSNVCGTGLSNAIAVTSLANKTVTLSANGSTTFCAGSDVTLNSTNPGASYTIQWYRNNISILSATNFSYLASNPGTYKVVTTNSNNGCSRISTSTVSTIVNCRLSSPTILSGSVMPDQFLKVYPNPISGSFTIEFSNEKEEAGMANIKFINTLGQIIYETDESVDNGKIMKEVNFGDKVVKGIYILKILLNGEAYESKVMIN